MLNKLNPFKNWRKIKNSCGIDKSFRLGFGFQNDFDCDSGKRFLNNAFFYLGHRYWWFTTPVYFKPREEWMEVPNDPYWKEHGGGYFAYKQRRYSLSYSGGYIHWSYDRKSGCFQLPFFEYHTKEDLVFPIIKNKPDFRQGLQRGNGSAFALIENARYSMDRETSFWHGDQTSWFTFIAFSDPYDGTPNVARISIQRYVMGPGDSNSIFWKTILPLFRKDIVSTTLVAKFKDEVGSEKGSWKGGTMGTSIDFNEGETVQEAFQRLLMRISK